MTKLRGIAMMVALAALLAACGGGSDAAADPEPPEIEYGRDICIECGMIIDAPRFAAAYNIDGEDKRFDDIGDMLVYGHENGELGSAIVWVHDFETERWIDADVAFYVLSDKIATPMGQGVAAFEDHDRAEAFATQYGAELVGWEELLALPTTDGRLQHAHHDDGEMDHAEMDHDEMGQDEEMDH